MPTRTTETLVVCIYLFAITVHTQQLNHFFTNTADALFSTCLDPCPQSSATQYNHPSWVLPDKCFVTSPSSTVSSTSNHPCVCRPPPLKFSIFSGTYSFLTPFSEEEVSFSKPKAESLSTWMAFHLFWNLILSDKSCFPNLQSLGLFLLCVQPC